MAYSYLIPDWFFGFGIGMEILFSIITIAVALVAFNISKITKEKNIRLFGIGFLLIGISYIILAGSNFWLVKAAASGFREVTLENIAFVGIIAIYSYMIMFISGLATLAYTTFNIKKGKAYYLLLGLSLLVVVSSLNKLVTFRILSVFIISFIAYHYLEEYIKNRNKKTLVVFIAFILLFLSSIGFIFSSRYYQAYVLGHILEFSAYLLILSILVRSVKK